MKRVVEHPALTRRKEAERAAFSEVWGRHMRIRKQVDVARDMAWIGMLSVNFTREEFASISHLLSPYELSLARKIWPDIPSSEMEHKLGWAR